MAKFVECYPKPFIDAVFKLVEGGVIRIRHGKRTERSSRYVDRATSPRDNELNYVNLTRQFGRFGVLDLISF